MTKTAFEYGEKTFSAEYVNRTHGSFIEITDDGGDYVEGIVGGEGDVSDAVRFFKNRRNRLDAARSVTAIAYDLPLQTSSKGA